MANNLFIHSTLLFIAMFFITSVNIAQNIMWQKCLGGTQADQGNTILESPVDGYVMVGTTNSNDFDVSGNHGNNDIWLCKINGLGALQWQKCLGGTSNEYYPYLQNTLDGGYILLAQTTSNDGDVSGNHGLSDMWVVKMDSIGTIQWQKCLGGSGNEWSGTIQPTADGGYIVGGATGSNDGDVTANHQGSLWVVKLAANGAIEWQKCFGGASGENAYDIKPAANGNYIVVGLTYSNDGNVSGNHGAGDIWAIQIDSVGNLMWQRCLGGTNYEFVHSVQNCSDGNYILAGATFSKDGDVVGNNSMQKGWLIKLDTLGNIIWAKCLGINTANNQQFNFIQTTSDGGYILTGSATPLNGNGIGEMWVIKTDSIGDIEWGKGFGGMQDDYGTYIQPTQDGGYISIGWTHSNNADVSGNNGGSGDVWIVKLDGNSLGITPNIRVENAVISPNPIVNNQFNLHYSLSQTSEIEINILDISGKIVKTLQKESALMGSYQKEINISELASGVYFLQMNANNGISSIKIVK